MTLRSLTLLFSMILLLCFSNVSAQWTDLTASGKDDWVQRGGSAQYEITDGSITGTAVLNSPNSFLCTKKAYGDFILEMDFYTNTMMNSGIQIRSLSEPDYKDGVVHGYQVEIDPTSRAFTGGIYDEQRRYWMYPLSRNEKAQSALRMGDWNHIRIEAIGNTINTWVNGIHCARLVDDLTDSGFIGLQVHSISEESGLEGSQVTWKNIRITENDLESNSWNPDPETPEINYMVNELTEWEKRNGFRLLWDGKTSDGWRGAKRENFPPSGWTMENGELTVEATDGGESTGPGDIVTTQNFSDFELILEFKITEGANSGIKYFVDPDLNKGEGSAIGCEFQILDDQRHPDAKMGVDGNRTIGSLYDLIAAQNISVPGRAKQFKGVGAWNRARIVSKDGHVEHWLNNEKVVEYNRYSQIFKSLVAYSKYAQWEQFGQWPEGRILLQDHGNTVSFRSIKIRELNE